MLIAGSVVALVGLGVVAAPFAPQAGASSTGVLSGVSCVGKACVVVGSTNSTGGSAIIAKTTDNGATWYAKKAPSGAASYNAVSCKTAMFCIAVGQDSSNNPAIAIAPSTGRIWTAQTAPAADGPLNAVFCASTTQCWAGGYSSGFVAGAVAQTSDGGVTWTPDSVPGGATGITDVTGVACKGSPTVTCRATGSGLQYAFNSPYLIWTTSKRTSWKQIPLGVSSIGQLNADSCLTVKKCVAVGQVNGAGYILTTIDGTTWTPETVPTGFATLNGVSCVNGTTTCYAAGKLSSGDAAVAVSTNSGTTWTAQSAPSGAGALSAVSCAKATTCVAVGAAIAGGGAVIATTNSGSTWTLETSPA